MRSRRRIDVRLVTAALLAVAVLLTVLAVTEYRHHDRITRWRELGISVHQANGSDWLPAPTGDHGYLSVRSILPATVAQQLPNELRLTWFVRPERLFVSPRGSVAEILELAEGSRLTVLHVGMVSSGLSPTDLEPVARVRTLQSLGLSVQSLERGHISPMRALPDLHIVHLGCESLTADACAELADLPSHVRLILSPYSPPRAMIAQVEELRKTRSVEVDGPWRVWFKEP